MTKFLTKTLGALFVLVGAAGIVLCILGASSIWKVTAGLRQEVLGYLEIAGSTLTTSQKTLELTEDALGAASSSLELLSSTTQTTNKTIDSLIPVLATISSLMKTDLPDTIEATRTSLVSAQTSAKLLDDFLAGLAKIPFINMDAYNPDVPLNESLGEIADSLADLPASFSTIDTNLLATNENLAAIQTDLEETENSILAIQQSLDASEAVLGSFKADLAALETRLADLSDSLEGGLDGLAQAATLVLIWLGFTQLGLVVQGFGLLRERK